MIERGQGGRIINISSVLGEGANTVHKTVGYAATKGAVTNMTRQLAVEWAPYGITVNALAPSWFPTEMITDPRLGRVHDEQQARMELFTPMGRLGRAGELRGPLFFWRLPLRPISPARFCTWTVAGAPGSSCSASALASIC